MNKRSQRSRSNNSTRNLILNPTSTMLSNDLLNAKFGSFENNESCAASCFVETFPLPFQEIGTTADEHRPPILRFSDAFPQGNGCLSQDRSYPAKTSGLLSLHDETQKEQYRHPTHPLQSEASCVFAADSSRQEPTRQKQQPVIACHRSNSSSAVLSGGHALPDDFVPRPWSVLFGRNKQSIDAPGNKRLRIIIGWYLERYVKSHTDKEAKSTIISEIASTIRSACEGKGGAFVRYTDGSWWEVESMLVREKIGRMLREALHTNYSSSSKQKRERHRLRRLLLNEKVTPREGNSS
jgi:hypothetical protein